MSMHDSQKVFTAGNKLKEADKAVIMLHGRGATAQGILKLSDRLPDAAYIAPQAANRTWYPKSFLEPVEQNQPYLDSALSKLDTVIEQVSKIISREKIVLLGFSQGACLASEYIARNPKGYGGLIVFSGGLIGESVGEFDGDLQETPVFIGCSEKDPHIPLDRVDETEEVFSSLNADVMKEIYPGRSHEVNDDEIKKSLELISKV